MRSHCNQVQSVYTDAHMLKRLMDQNKPDKQEQTHQQTSSGGRQKWESLLSLLHMLHELRDKDALSISICTPSLVKCFETPCLQSFWNFIFHD